MGNELIGAGEMRTRSASGLLQVLLPRPLRAKVVVMVQTRRMKLTGQRKLKLSEAQQLEITETKKFEIVRHSEKRSVRMDLAAAKAVQNDGEATVLFPQSSSSYLALLKLSILRVRSFASTTLADRVFQGRQHQQCSFRCPCPSRSPAIQDRTKEDRATTGEARSCWKESIH